VLAVLVAEGGEVGWEPGFASSELGADFVAGEQGGRKTNMCFEAFVLSCVVLVLVLVLVVVRVVVCFRVPVLILLILLLLVFPVPPHSGCRRFPPADPGEVGEECPFRWSWEDEVGWEWEWEWEWEYEYE
jgi:hypothetical protein